MFQAYNEQALIEKLRGIPPESRVAFALLCDERLLPSYKAFHDETGKGNISILAAIADRLWNDISGEKMSTEEVEAKLQACMESMPSEEDASSSFWAHAEDAVSALAYTLRARLSGESQEAAWAARRAYESLDHYVIQRDQLDLNKPGGEFQVMQHPLVQAELWRQQRDLDELQSIADPGGLAENATRLRARAIQEGLLFLAATGSAVPR